MSLNGNNLIGLELSGRTRDRFRALNPASGEYLPGEFAEAEAEEVDRAVAKAVSAFSAFSKIFPERRAAFLEAIAEEILALGEELIVRTSLETALPHARLTGERGRTMNQLRMFAALLREGSWLDARIDTADPSRQIPKPDIRQMHIPIGPVAIFGASNFPLAFSVAGGDTASALAAGCPVVVKAHPLHPGCSEMVGQAILKAAQKTGMPEGVFSLLHGRSFEPGIKLVTHPDIKAVGFTGSFRGGKALFDAANARPEPIPVFAEMGSVNPVFILPGALAKGTADLARTAVSSICLGTGQFCTNPGVLVGLRNSFSDIFLQELAAELEVQKPGAMLGSSIYSTYDSGLSRMKQNEEVSLLAISEAVDLPNAPRSVLLKTTARAFLTDNSLSHENFGPSSIFVDASSRDELLQIARSLDGQLTATLLAEEAELDDFSELISILQNKVGRLIFNAFPTGVEVCHAMVHGGPYPATTAPQSTSVGTLAIKRFVRPVCFQGFPDAALPEELRNGNSRNIWRLVDGEFTKADIETK